MRVYLDMCCLKRPFDDQSQPRIHLESEAVLSLLAGPADRVEFVRSAAHDIENDQNPLPRRARRVREWLQAKPTIELNEEALKTRTTELMGLGFRNFDAFHLACAELGASDAFATSDDRLLAIARKQAAALKVRVLNPVELAAEVFA